MAVLCQCLQGLIYQSHIALVDVQTKETQPASGGAANAVQEHEGLGDQVVVGLVVLVAQEILEKSSKVNKTNHHQVQVLYGPQLRVKATMTNICNLPAVPGCDSHKEAAGSAGLVASQPLLQEDSPADQPPLSVLPITPRVHGILVEKSKLI